MLLLKIRGGVMFIRGGVFDFRSDDFGSCICSRSDSFLKTPMSDESHNLGGEMPHEENRVLHQSQHLGGDC